jgi:pyruvate formate lyase activating enzyme
MTRSLIFDLKRYAINDGPGIRLVVFFKGCNLSCAWCHNPESISAQQEKMYSLAKCTHCGTCVNACPQKALSLTTSGVLTDQGKCTLCGLCAEVCPTLAMEMMGKEMSVSEIMEVIENEVIFFNQSGGGVTFSGGEPLLHHKFLFELLQKCRERGIHTAIDTAGNVSTQTILKAAELADMFLYDLKTMNNRTHRQWTNSDNNLIIKNLRMLSEKDSEIIIRIPLIKDINDTKQNMIETAEFIQSLNNSKIQVQLLTYHNIAQHKYQKLNKNYQSDLLCEPSGNSIKEAISIFASYGIVATLS